MGKHKHFKFMGFLNILGEVEIHTIPNICEYTNSYKMEIFRGKPYHRKSEVITKPK